MIEEAELQCPYCWEKIVLEIDLSESDATFIQDCTVCCQPLQLHLRVAPDGAYALDVAREND